jgi:hypothetical protein
MLAVGLAVFESLAVAGVIAVPWLLTEPWLSDPQAGDLIVELRRFLYWVCGFAVAPWLLAAALLRPKVRLTVLGLLASSPGWAALIALSSSR